MMMSEKLEKSLAREEAIAEDELAAGLIDVAEYNQRIRELEREAHYYSGEGRDEFNEEHFHEPRIWQKG